MVSTLDVKSTIVPGRGTVLIADPDTPPPDLTKFNFAVPSTYQGWSIGYTSKENLPEMSKDGGDLNSLDAWEADSIETSQAAIKLGLNFSKIQIDQDNLALAFPAGNWNASDGSFDVEQIGTVEKALMIVVVSGSNKRSGIYFGRATVSIGDMPKLDAEKFMELSLTSQMHPDANGKLFRWFPVVAGVVLSTAAPTVSNADPSSGAVGTKVTLTGTQFADATNVKFGAATAQFTIDSATQITATVPTVATGSQPIVVTNPKGSSAGTPFTVQ